MADKCPTCKGPVDKPLPCHDSIHSVINATKHTNRRMDCLTCYGYGEVYRSTAAEQLAVEKQRKETAISMLNDNEIKRDLIADLTSESKKIQNKLAAAEAVVENIDSLLQSPASGSQITATVAHIIANYRKLQGSE